MFTITSFRLLFLVLIITASYGHGELHTGFDGSTYVTYSYHGEPRTLPDDILLVFRTIKPSGILFHAASSGGDFITLELQRGKIRYVSLLGCFNLSEFTSLPVLSMKWDVDYFFLKQGRHSPTIFGNCSMGSLWLELVTSVLFNRAVLREKQTSKLFVKENPPFIFL